MSEKVREGQRRSDEVRGVQLKSGGQRRLEKIRDMVLGG
jgi:hypothetical protein